MATPLKPNHVTTTPKGTLVFMRTTVKRGKRYVDQEIVVWDKNRNKKLDRNDLVLVTVPRGYRCPRGSVFKPGAEGANFCRRKATARDVSRFGNTVKQVVARALKHRSDIKKSAKPITTGICFEGASLPFNPPLTLTSVRLPKSKRYTRATNFKNMTSIDPRRCNMVGASMTLLIGGSRMSAHMWMSGPWNFLHAGALGVTRNPDAVHVTYYTKGIRYMHLDMHK